MKIEKETWIEPAEEYTPEVGARNITNYQPETIHIPEKKCTKTRTTMMQGNTSLLGKLVKSFITFGVFFGVGRFCYHFMPELPKESELFPPAIPRKVFNSKEYERFRWDYREFDNSDWGSQFLRQRYGKRYEEFRDYLEEEKRWRFANRPGLNREDYMPEYNDFEFSMRSYENREDYPKGIKKLEKEMIMEKYGEKYDALLKLYNREREESSSVFTEN